MVVNLKNGKLVGKRKREKQEKQEKPNTVARKKPDDEKEAGTLLYFIKIELKKTRYLVLQPS